MLISVSSSGHSTFYPAGSCIPASDDHEEQHAMTDRMDDIFPFGVWVRRRRKALDLTQAALAQCVGCAEVTIRKIEANAMNPSRTIAQRLATCLAIPPGEHALFLRVANGERGAAGLPAPLTGLDASPPLPAGGPPSGDRTPDNIDVVLVPQAPAPVILSGQVKDASGQGLAQQHILLHAQRGSISLSQTTDETGTYRFEVPPGSYHLHLSGMGRTNAWQNVPPRYNLSSDHRHRPLTLNANTTLDLVLPFKRVVVHVEDSHGQPAAGAQIETSRLRIDDLSLGSFSVSGFSEYSSREAVTNAAGDAVLWLFPTPPHEHYTFTVTPPAGTPFAVFRVPNITVTSNTSKVIVLQYN
jgi:DNA-binding XRE family transcriptional regulator